MDADHKTMFCGTFCVGFSLIRVAGQFSGMACHIDGWSALFVGLEAFKESKE